MDVWWVKTSYSTQERATVESYLDILEHQWPYKPVQNIKPNTYLCYITVLNTAECLLVYHLWISRSICQGGGWARGWSARLRGDTPSKGPQWGSFVQLLSRVHPNPQEPPVTATGKWGMLKEAGGWVCTLWSVWLVGFAELEPDLMCMSHSLGVLVITFFLIALDEFKPWLKEMVLSKIPVSLKSLQHVDSSEIESQISILFTEWAIKSSFPLLSSQGKIEEEQKAS